MRAVPALPSPGRNHSPSPLRPYDLANLQLPTQFIGFMMMFLLFALCGGLYPQLTSSVQGYHAFQARARARPRARRVGVPARPAGFGLKVSDICIKHKPLLQNPKL